MARRTTLTGVWADMVDAYGGVEKLTAHLGVNPGTLHRTARQDPGAVKKLIRDQCERAAADKGLPNPFERPTKPPPPAIEPVSGIVLHLLEMIGNSAVLDTASPSAIARVRQAVTDEQLITLTEQDGVPESVLKACTILLEMD